MTLAFLKINRRIVYPRKIRRLATEELHSNSEKVMRKDFDDSIKKIHGE